MTRPVTRLVTRRSPKPCGRCGEFDPACGFGVDMGRNEGLAIYCATCSHRANRERYLRDRRDLQRRTRYEGEPYREPKVEGFECCDLNFRTEQARDDHRALRGCGKENMHER